MAMSVGLDTSCTNSVMFLARSSGVRLHGNVGAGVVGAMKTGVGLGVGLVVERLGVGALVVAPAVGLIVEISAVGDSVTVVAVGFSEVLLPVGDSVVLLVVGNPVAMIAVGFSVSSLVVGFSDVASAVGIGVATKTVGFDVDEATGLGVGLTVMTVGLFVGFAVIAGKEKQKLNRNISRRYDANKSLLIQPYVECSHFLPSHASKTEYPLPPTLSDRDFGGFSRELRLRRQSLPEEQRMLSK